MIEHIETGEQISDEVAQDMIRRTIERTGKFLLCSRVKPTLGEVQNYAGLPMRAVRHVSLEEAREHDEATADIWKDVSFHDDDFHFEVEVAD
jgi:hypothetical protein